MAATSGLAVGVAFPPVDAVVGLPVGVAGLTFACRGATARQATALGGCFGLPFMLVLLPWMRVIGNDAWLALAALQALFYAGLGLALALVTRLPAWPMWSAAVWVAAELARSSVPFGGFPWGRLAFALVDTPLAAYARIGGVALVSAVVALTANLVLWSLTRWWQHGEWRGAGAGLLFVAALVLGGLVLPLQAATPDDAPVVAVVQGNVPDRGLAAFGQRRAVLDNHAEATHQLARAVSDGRLPAPDLVIWPENSTDIDPFADPSARASISAAIADVAVPGLVGAVVDGPVPDQVQNIGIVWDPVTGPGERYVKRHPVPFGEYIPFRQLLTRYISRLDQIPEDFAEGSKPGVLQVAGVTVGDVICFEVAYDQLIRDLVSGGAQLIVVQTNNATYLGTGQLEQQWAISRLRAIETGRTVVVAATNGISGFASPDGEVVQRSAAGTRDLLVQPVTLSSSVPLGISTGRGLEWVLAGIGVAAAVGAAVRSRRTRTVRR